MRIFKIMIYLIPLSVYSPINSNIGEIVDECRGIEYYIQQDIDSILPTIITIESNNNPNTIGDNGKAIGLLQIHKECVQDVNRTFNTNYSHNQMIDSLKSVQVFKLYLTKGINRYMYKYDKYPQTNHIVRMWNGGIYQGYRINDTKKYFEKYQSKLLLKDN